MPLAAPGTQRAAQLGAAVADDNAKYIAFKNLVGPAKEIFDQLFKVKGPTPNLDPDP